MRRIALFLLASLILAPAFADDLVRAEVAYDGRGKFLFHKKHYDYQGVVAAIRADHPDEKIDIVVVDMGTVINQLDRNTVCQLRQDLQARVKMKLTVGEDKQELFCN